MKRAAFRLQPVLELRRVQERAAALAAAEAARAATDAVLAAPVSPVDPEACSPAEAATLAQSPEEEAATCGVKRDWMSAMRPCTALRASTPPPPGGPGGRGR